MILKGKDYKLSQKKIVLKLLEGCRLAMKEWLNIIMQKDMVKPKNSYQ